MTCNELQVENQEKIYRNLMLLLTIFGYRNFYPIPPFPETRENFLDSKSASKIKNIAPTL